MSDDPIHRQELVDGGHLFFQDGTQKPDLLNGGITQDCLISLLTHITGLGYHLEITAVRTDHGDDSALGLHTHANGYAVDCWPLTGPTPGAYLDANDQEFQRFLHDVAQSPNLYQIGLGGGAYTSANAIAAGPTVFEDNGQDHVHLGAQ